MITFEYRFDILPGKASEYERYVKGPGRNIWAQYRGVKAVRKYKSMLGGSSPQRVVQVDLDSLATLEYRYTQLFPKSVVFFIDAA